MGANIWPVNAVSSSPQYVGRMLRQTTVAPFTAMGSAARPLGAKSGCRVGTPSSIVTVTSTTWTVQPFVGVIDGEAAAAAGPYGYSFDTAQTGSVVAAGSSARKDRLDVQVSDPAESDGSSVPSIAIIYTQGPTTGGTLNPAPARSHALCVINVPATGGGTPTITWAPDWSGDPGEWQFNTKAELDTYTTAITTANIPIGQVVQIVADTTNPWNNGEWKFNGTAWVGKRLDILGIVNRHNTAVNFGNTYADLSSTAWWDVVTAHNLTYNNGWTVPVDGIYEVTTGLTADAAFVGGFTINKTAPAFADIHQPSVPYAAAGVCSTVATTPVALHVGDVLRIYAVTSTGVANWNTNPFASQFSVRWVGAL